MGAKELADEITELYPGNKKNHENCQKAGEKQMLLYFSKTY